MPGRTLLLLACFAAFTSEAQPILLHRTIAPDPSLESKSGITLYLHEGDTKFPLFIPNTFKPAGTNLTVTIHFHTASWFIIQEHIRREASHPLACLHLGEGSSIYQRAFSDPNRLARIIAATETGLQTQHANAPRINRLELSSFSAGYGAIREILRSGKYMPIIHTVLLADSMYASLEKEVVTRKPSSEHINVWLPFAREAIAGNKTFLITCSDVPTSTYASSSECVQALAEKLNLSFTPADKSLPAGRDKDFPLLRRLDAGRFQIWHYGGTNAQAHLTHVRHLGDLWKAVQPDVEKPLRD